MDIGTVRRIDIDDEMQQSYLDYAMSVIVARALPDARDGLKPVHRRILYAMHDMGIRPETDYRKSARIVGEVLGKYHPHGDMAVYEAMARMAQDFSMRYPLTDGQGNFGSIDGDAPAAMRYTEARLAGLAMEMLADIDRQTVEFVDNFDGSLREPTVLPAGAPNLLVNGATGIAVGMATSIPPHNMAEVCDALTYMLDNWSALERISVDDLMQFVRGPDFPTGGVILREPGDADGVSAAYATGRGRFTVQARAHIEEIGRGRSRIIVTELPYQTNKASLIERIAELARTAQLEGLSDLRDESDRQGMRIVIELSKTADPPKVLAELYRRTPMQTTFGVMLLALVEGEPRLLGLKQALRVYLEHRLEVVRRRSRFELQKARERAHILEGLRVALDHLDEVLAMIRSARDVEQARQRLIRRFRLSEAQAHAILEMPLRRLAALERKKIEQEHKETLARIRELETLLASEKKQRAAIAEELAGIRSRYGDRRRTQIVALGKGRRAQPVLTAGDLADLAPARDTWVVLTKDGRLSRTASGRVPRLAGRDAPALVAGASGRDTLYLFDQDGRAAALPMHTLPESDDPAQGAPLASVSALPAEARVAAAVALPTERAAPRLGGGFLVLCTRLGMVKRLALESLPGHSGRLFNVMSVAADDALGWARPSAGTDDILLVSSEGMAIRFEGAEVRPTGLAAGGVLGMRLGPKAALVGMDIARSGSELLVVAADGRGKRTALKDFPRQGRNGKGVLTWQSGGQAGLIGAAAGTADDRVVLHLSRGPARSLRLGDAPRRARTAAGVPLVELKKGERLDRLTPVQARTEIAAPPEPNGKKPRAVPTARAARKPVRKAARSAAKKRATGKPTKKSAARSPASKKPAGRSKKNAGAAKKTARKSPARKRPGAG